MKVLPNTPTEYLSPEMMSQVRNQPVDLTHLLDMVYRDIEIQIARLDGKAQFALIADAILSGLIALVGLDFDFVGASSSIESALTFADSLMFITLMLSVLFALAAIFPRTPRYEESMIYPIFIATMDEAAYTEDFLNLSIGDIKTGVIRHIHARSLIVRRKTLHLQRSTILLTLAVAMFAAAQVLQLTY